MISRELLPIRSASNTWRIDATARGEQFLRRRPALRPCPCERSDTWALRRARYGHSAPSGRQMPWQSRCRRVLLSGRQPLGCASLLLSRVPLLCAVFVGRDLYGIHCQFGGLGASQPFPMSRTMKPYQTYVDDLACAVHDDHQWSPAGILLPLGMAEHISQQCDLSSTKSPRFSLYFSRVRMGLPRTTLCKPVRSRTATESMGAGKVAYLHHSDTVVL